MRQWLQDMSPANGSAAMEVYDALDAVSMSLTAVPYVANAASRIAKKVDSACLCGAFGRFDYII